MSTEVQKTIVHLELSRKATELLYALNRQLLQRPCIPEPEDEADTHEACVSYVPSGLSKAVRAAFVNDDAGSTKTSFTDADFDELTREIGTTVWDALRFK